MSVIDKEKLKEKITESIQKWGGWYSYYDIPHWARELIDDLVKDLTE